ncbi:MAG TPA: sigma-54 dependent transcriptional regulator [bacterium]|nr:sigma-54 dependent transcriptional regulator [bacterium]
MPDRILVVDDKQSIVEILETVLREDGYAVSSAFRGEEAIKKLEEESYELLLCDIRLPDIDGMKILEYAVSREEGPAVIMITAYGSIENAIECMKLGADDYITKPFNLDELRAVVRKVLGNVKLLRENAKLRAELKQKYDFSGIIGKSKQMQEVFEKIKRVAPTNTSVLISGETGVGKELVAKAIHYNSPRARKDFVALNCAAIPEHLLESELFGHVKGAFTGAISNKNGIFEEADGGTLLLDEIGELHMSLQAKLLRVLDEGSVRRVGDNKNIPVDVRLICCTNKRLEEEIEKKNFRLDLYHRIKVVEIAIPPVRERKEDIIAVAEFYLQKISREHGKSLTRLNPEAVTLMLSHQWQGNVREIINVMEQAVLLAESDPVGAGHLPSLSSSESCDFSVAELLGENTLKKMLDRVEKEIISRVLEEAGGNRKETARRLGVSERALYYKLDEYDLK